MPFQYQSLRPNEIRVLRPRSNSENRLSFTIAHVALAINQGYVALSYTWGPPSESDAQTMLLDGQEIAISQNLHDALAQIRSSRLINHYIWADAICINQADGQEKSRQISLMKDIYEQATKVIVWLGLPDDENNNRLAISMMKYCFSQVTQIQKDARPFRPWWWQGAARTLGEDSADLQVKLDPTQDKRILDVPGSQSYKAWEGIVSIWQKPWWTRTWIFQESTVPESLRTTRYIDVLGARIDLPRTTKVIFLCGDQKFSWPEATHAVIVANNIMTTPRLESPLYHGVGASFVKLQRFREERNYFANGSFLQILQVFRQTQCRDLRDKVYAPLCLAPIEVRRSIIPDYTTKTVRDTYMDVVRYCLAQPEHELDFLGHARYEETQQRVQTPTGVTSIVPSWVPNFAVSQHLAYPIPKVMYAPEVMPRRNFKLLDTRGGPSKSPIRVPVYQPLGGFPLAISIRDNELHLTGIKIDNVVDIIANTGTDIAAIEANAKQRSERWSRSMNQTYFTGESYLTAVRKTMVLDLIYDDYGRPSTRGGEINSQFLATPPAQLSNEERQRQMKMRYARNGSFTMRNLALSQRHYLLMIPDTAVVGDLVWAFTGGRALYVLRPLNEATKVYRFIGECYAHGLMDGRVATGSHSVHTTGPEGIVLV